MANELIIRKNSAGVEIALLSDGKLAEFHKESVDSTFQVGDFYLGRVRKLSPSMNAAFVDVGGEKDGFLTYFDLGPNIRSVKKFTKAILDGNSKLASDLDNFELEEPTVKTGKVGQVLKAGERILVQVIKEPIASKGPKITCDLSLAGRFFVLVPFSKQISISKKIGNPSEKSRLKDLANSLKPRNFGIIIRTVAEGVALEELDRDIRDLLKKWDDMVRALGKAKPGSKILGDGNRVETLLRDILNDSFSQISVNDGDLHNQLKKTLERFGLDPSKLLRHYQGKTPIFDQFGVTRQVKASFGKNVPFSGGAYLVIDHTEALHVIDVNSGSTSYDPQNREDNVLKINLEAVDEVARQIRLRDMGGIIVIDFIDMRDPKRKTQLHQALKQAMSTDRARHNILPMTKFGLVQITRERVRPAMEIVTSEVCPTCNGSGRIDSSMQLIDRLENEVTYLWENLNLEKLTLKANPLLTGFIKSGFPSQRMRWFRQYGHWLRLKPDTSMGLSSFHFENQQGQAISNQ